MFIGHYAISFASKRFAQRTSLGMLLIASLWLDLIWPVFILLDWEKVRIEPGYTAFTPLNFISYPYSHSLLTSAGWATLLAIIYLAVSRYRAGAIAIWLGVISHWFLDFITHRADMPLYPGGPKFGLALWNSPIATVAVEGFMYTLAVWIYVRVTRPKDKIGAWAFRAYVVMLAVFYIANAVSPPPAEIKQMLFVAMPMVWLLIAWGWWADKHREPRRFK